MTIKDLLELEAGDIIFTDKDVSKNFDLFVEGKHVYAVQAGICNGKKAVQIVSES